ncbi:MAG: hypothetical protein WEK74_02635 [Hydrogenophaga sp.]
MRISHWTRIGCLAVATLALTACGGGKDDPVAADTGTDAVAKYVGSWESECYADSGASAELRADFTKQSAIGLGGNVTVYYYIGSSCSGPVVKDEKVLANLSLELQGPRAISGVTGDGFSGSSAEGSAKVVLYTNGSTLQIGDVKAAPGADGFATTFYEYALKRL